MSENQNTEQKSSQIEWQELDQAIRKMIILSLWQEDMQKYYDLKESVDENIQS